MMHTVLHLPSRRSLFLVWSAVLTGRGFAKCLYQELENGQ